MKTVVLKKKEKKIHLNCTDDIADILMSSETGDYCYTTKVYNAVIYIDSFFYARPTDVAWAYIVTVVRTSELCG